MIVDMTQRRRLEVVLERGSSVIPDWLAAMFDLESEAMVTLLVTDEAAFLRRLAANLGKRAKAVEEGVAGFGVDHFLGAGHNAGWGDPDEGETSSA